MRAPIPKQFVSFLWPTAQGAAVRKGGRFAHPKIKDAHPSQEYYLNGFSQQTWKKSAAYVKLVEALQVLHDGEPKAGFTWQQKYAGTQDFRPDVADYDNIFLDILFDQGIPQMLKEVTGLDLYLGHLQLRRVFPNANYMDWHRDTHFYGGKLAGNIPPVHKIIFYPNLGAKPAPTLLVCPGSHRRMLASKIRDIAQVRTFGQEVITSSDEQYLLFDTSLLHAVVPQRVDPKGAFRLMYSFYHDWQLEKYPQFQALAGTYRAKL